MISSDDYTYVDKIEIKGYEPNDEYGRWPHGINYCELNIFIKDKIYNYDTFIKCPFKVHNIAEIKYKTHGLLYGISPITLAIKVIEETYGLLIALAGKKELKKDYILLDNNLRMPLTTTSLQGLVFPFIFNDYHRKLVVMLNSDKYLDRIREIL
jgi:hypothetical protein